MNNILTGSILKITSRNRATTPLNGSIATNGGISCSNILCDKDITVNDIIVKNSITAENLDITDSIKINGSVLPYNNIMSSIGMDSMRWDTIYCKNLDATGNITLGEKNSGPIVEILDNIVCNSDISLLNNGKKFIETDSDKLHINGDLFVNNIFKIVGNSYVDIKGDLKTSNIDIREFINIEPSFITIDKDNFTVNVTSSVIVLTIRIDTNIDFISKGNNNNVLVKVFLINYGNYDVTVSADNKEIITNKGFDIFVINNGDKILLL